MFFSVVFIGSLLAIVALVATLLIVLGQRDEARKDVAHLEPTLAWMRDCRDDALRDLQLAHNENLELKRDLAEEETDHGKTINTMLRISAHKAEKDKQIARLAADVRFHFAGWRDCADRFDAATAQHHEEKRQLLQRADGLEWLTKVSRQQRDDVIDANSALREQLRDAEDKLAAITEVVNQPEPDTDEDTPAEAA